MLSARVFRSHTVAVGITYARTLKSRQLLLKPQKNTAVTIGGIFLVEVTGLEPTTSWSLTKRATKLRYTSVSLAKQHILLYRIYKKCQAIFCLYLKNFQTERIFSKSLAAPQRSLRDSKNYRKQSDRTYQPKKRTVSSNAGLSP